MLKLVNRISEQKIRNEAKEILRNAPEELNVNDDIPTKLISIEQDGKLIDQYIETNNMNYINYKYEKVNDGKYINLLRELSEKYGDEMMEHKLKVSVLDSKNLDKVGETTVKITVIPFLETD